MASETIGEGVLSPTLSLQIAGQIVAWPPNMRFRRDIISRLGLPAVSGVTALNKGAKRVPEACQDAFLRGEAANLRLQQAVKVEMVIKSEGPRPSTWLKPDADLVGECDEVIE